MERLRGAECYIKITYFQENRIAKGGLADHINLGLRNEAKIKQPPAHLAATIMTPDTDAAARLHLAQGQAALLTGYFITGLFLLIPILAFFIGAKKTHTFLRQQAALKPSKGLTNKDFFFFYKREVTLST